MISFPGGPVEPEKAHFLSSLLAGLKAGDVPVVRDPDSCSKDWSLRPGELTETDLYVLALASWYRFCGVLAPPTHLLRSEAELFASNRVLLDPPVDLVADDLLVLSLRLRRAWSAETTAAKEWSWERPETGQCAVTALLVQEQFGGDLLRVQLSDQSHYLNQLPDGRIVDLTVAQFDLFEPLGPPEVRTREYVLSHPDTALRYGLLVERLKSKL